MFFDNFIHIKNISKAYHMYEKPIDRLKQTLFRGKRQFYKEFWALKNINLEIKAGETVGIIGRNGSGKSTLLQIICGTLSPTTGEVITQGRIAALLELGAGFNPEFTGIENIYMACSVYGLSNDLITERLDKIINFAEIGPHINQPVKTYSSGMYVRLGFAVIAHIDADILVIDEALAVGDALFTQKCMRFLRKFMETGTVLFVSHDTSSVINLCNRAIWLDKGEVKQIDSPKIVAQNYLADLYNSTSGPQIVNGSFEDKREDNDKDANTTDCRENLTNYSNLRNDLKVFNFDSNDSAEFGIRGAEITNVYISKDSIKNVTSFIGGETVCLKIEIFCRVNIKNPIVGFSFKDKLGQVLFGDNTFLQYLDRFYEFHSGSKYVATFKFKMPILPAGDYSIAAAIASGSQLDHVQHHWVHDALIIRSLSSSVSTGLVGIPMLQIELNGV